MNKIPLSAGCIAALACSLEVAAAKPGNVHRGADFDDVTLQDFLASAIVVGHAIDQQVDAGVGETILAAIQATRSVTDSNTNLGMVLLLVPLAKANSNISIGLDQSAIGEVMRRLTARDAEQVFEAIRIAQPAGLGNVEHLDVQNSAGPLPHDLIAAMQLSAERDLIARQYVNNFEQVITRGVPNLIRGRARFQNLSQAIVFAHVAVMAEFPDSLIARKCGVEVARHSQMLAARAMDAFDQDEQQPRDSEIDEGFWNAVSELDFWLRSDGRKRNPGTTADLVAASLFVAINNGQIQPPFR